MAPNHLQFQPGLSLNEFPENNVSQAQCEAALENAHCHRDTIAPDAGAAATASPGIVR